MVYPPKSGYYISRPEKFKELLLLKVAKSSDSRKANAAKTSLILQNEGFLKSTIAKWIPKYSHHNFDSLLEEARIAFLTAVNNYNLNRDISIRTYARYHLLDLKRRFFKKSRYEELAAFHLEGDYEIRDFDQNNIDLRQILLSAIITLTPTEQQVINLHFFQGMKKCEVAKLRGCSEARICTIVKEALPKLRTHLKQSGIIPGNFNFN